MKSVFFFEMQIETSLYLRSVLFYCNFILQAQFIFLSRHKIVFEGFSIIFVKEIFLKYQYLSVIIGKELEENFKIRK